jgi:S-formylglutathione hydrolase FrmB
MKTEPVSRRTTSGYLIILFLLAVLFVCQPYAPEIRANTGERTMEAGKDTTFVINGLAVDILYPDSKPAGCILVLPGWNFSRQAVCTFSDFCKLAKAKGYTLILPEMGKSAYLFACFPETRADWIHYPTLTWVLDTLIPACQEKFGLLKPGERNFLFGISTGGRGVAQIALNTGRLFIAGASLSGDFNQLLQKDDRLMTGYIGEYEKFSSRWSGKDNPSENAAKLEIPLYLGHGAKDNVVPVRQTAAFFDRISSLNPQAGHVRNIAENGEHNWDYWNSEMQRIFAFFHEKSMGK